MKYIVVRGAPASGKSTYVKQNAKYGDLVIDIDSLKSVLFFGFGRVYDDVIANRIAVALRKFVLDETLKYSWSDKTVWLITSSNNAMVFRELTEKLKAEIVHIDTPREECLRRVKLDESRPDKELQREIIDRYFGGGSG